MIIGNLIVFAASLFFYIKSRKIEGILLMVSSLALILTAIYTKYIYPIWLYKNNGTTESIANFYMSSMIVTTSFSIGLGIGFALLVRRFLEQEKILKNLQQ